MPTSVHPVSSRRLPVILAGLLTVLLVLAPARAAWAHAELVATDPADGEVVDVAPQQLTLQFTEDVTVQPDGVRVLDAQAERVDRGDAVSQGSTVTAPVLDDLEEGTYVVAWRVVSADGHPVRGAYTFSVGRETTVADDLADQAFAAGGDRADEVAAAVLRAIAYIAVLGACGYVVAMAALRRPEDPSPVGRGTTAAALVGVAAIVGQVPIQAALASGRGLGAVTDSSVLAQVLGDGVGLSLAIGALGLAAIVVTAGLPWTGPARKVGVAGAVVAPLGFVVSGHTRTMTPLVVGMVADAAHLAAATLWFGGLVALWVAVRRRRRAGDPLGAAEAVARFSGWAAVSLAVVTVAGVVLAWSEVGSLDGLTSTTYGRLLVAKVALVVAVAALGGWNRLRLVPRVAAASLEEPARDDGVAWRTLLRTVAVEVGVLVVVLAITGVLVSVTPAKVSADRGPVAVTGAIAAGTMDVTVDPARPGRNDLHVYLYDEDGSPADQYDEAAVRLELPSQGLGPFEEEAVKVGPGHFQVVAAELSLAGEWQATVTVKPDRFTEQSGVVQFDVR